MGHVSLRLRAERGPMLFVGAGRVPVRLSVGQPARARQLVCVLGAPAGVSSSWPLFLFPLLICHSYDSFPGGVVHLR